MAEDLSFEDISHLVDGTPEPALVEATGAPPTPVGELGFNMATLVNNEVASSFSVNPLTDSDSVHLWRCTNRPESAQWSKVSFKVECTRYPPGWIFLFLVSSKYLKF